MTHPEIKRAGTLSQKIVQRTGSNDLNPKLHLGEAQAIALALRKEFRRDVLLLDELAARDVAKEVGVKVSGFPGVLLFAARAKLITPEDLRTRLEICRSQGTRYATSFIQQVPEMALEDRGVR